MELFLNLLWVLIALGLLGTWRMQWVHQRRRTRRHSVQEWAAISVALVLLFFAVSLTDDLHSELLLMAECSGNRRSLVCSISAHQFLPSGTSSPASDPAIAFHASNGVSLRAIQSVERVDELCKSFFQNDRPTGRAPPASFL